MNLVDYMTLETYENKTLDNKPLIYRAYVPKEKQDKYRVFIFLHGAGERGNDGAFHITPNADIIKRVINHPIYGKNTICIAPQVPANESWMPMEKIYSGEYDFDKNEKTPLQAIFNDFIENELPRKYNIDEDHIYIGGLSMGASGAIDYLMRYPNKFAASVLICGIMDLNKLDTIRHIPMWLFHSKDDTTVSPHAYIKGAKMLKEMGANIRFTLYEDAGHPSWRRAFLVDDLIDWLFSHTRQQ
ncbi:alpha/beta hydrolase-fold protein [Acholeplasma hippikon]|uniref:Predicted esterase n=1 Tax=Acholeplasma hippikon TaxID=264636 RepID=A0A449BIS2_9MOLU|nr:alpha/beta hydrolase-fold protein [Acholeplasma hippikon]VEU82303.1 Predicted esterase [Acholeplasma hippikon]